MAIQRFLIQKILQPLHAIFGGWSEKTRERVFVWSCFAIIVQHFLNMMGVILYTSLPFDLIGCFFLGLMILSSLPRQLHPVQFRKLPAFCWFGIGFLMLLAGLLVSNNRIPESMLFLVGLPVCFIVWNNNDREKVMHLLVRACIYSFILYNLINILLYPMGTKQYAGLMRNVNGAAFYLLLVLACLLVELLEARKFDRKLLGLLVLLGLCAAQIYYTSSRTGYLAAILVALCVLPMHLVLHRKEKQRFTLYVLLLGCVSIVVCTYLGLYLFQFSKLIPQAWIDWLNLPETPAYDGLVLDLDAIANLNNNKFALFGKSLDQISSGRISIWKAFGADLNWLGNPDGKLYYIPILKKEMVTAHNTILQMAYECGIPTGILYLVFNLTSGVLAILFARKNRSERYALLPLAVTVAFGFMSLLSSLENAFSYMITLYYYLLQFPLIAAAAKKGKREA